MRIRQLTATAGVAAAALLLTACGSDSPLEGKSGEEVAAMAADALEEAGAVHVTGTMEQDGEEGEIDLQLQGDDVSGSISLGGVEIGLIVADGEVFMQAPADFWAGFGMPEEAAAEFDDAWVIVPSDAAADFADFSLAGIADELRDPDGDVKEETRSDELDGDPVRIVEQEDGSTLTVADDDPAYPLAMSNEEEGSELTFSDFGEEQDISAPADAIDLTEMMAG
ncbi:hypothetical protein [Blastococcus sp. TF02A-30]|uniref:hypothetical protein n=1 Tax=Blastococcus sp. TF02A-30 TaxID=2250580 RepID=UPI000DE8F341|nr:hypothetical protein [Blastococcus sp. TF02A-30]RBY92775.1 hypothetical protein DQ241_01575 [Blastococcus sp. TF02A-30]